MSMMKQTKIGPALQLQGESETYRVTGSYLQPELHTHTLHKLTSNLLKGGFKIVDRWFQVPLDYFNPVRGTIKIFARNAIPNKKDDNGTAGGKLPYCS